MRQKADKLEKGKWYWDSSQTTLLKYSHSDCDTDYYSDCIQEDYLKNQDGFYDFFSGSVNRFLPTPKDIQKYNLNETDK